MTTPTVQQTIAILSALVHAEELLNHVGPLNSAHLNAFEADKAALRTSIDQVRPLMAEYDTASMLPVRRDGVRYK